MGNVYNKRVPTEEKKGKEESGGTPVIGYGSGQKAG